MFLHDVVEPGDELDVRGPIGGWFVWEGTTPALLVGGGSGVVPLMAMLRHARRTGRADLLRLVVSARSPDVLYYAAELPGPETTVVFTRSVPPGHRPGARPAGHGDVPLPLADDVTAYVCGSAGFAEAAEHLLARRRRAGRAHPRRAVRPDGLTRCRLRSPVDGATRRARDGSAAGRTRQYLRRLEVGQRRLLQLRLHLGGQMGTGELGPGLLVVFEGPDAGRQGRRDQARRAAARSPPLPRLDLRQADLRREAAPLPAALLPASCPASAGWRCSTAAGTAACSSSGSRASPPPSSGAGPTRRSSASSARSSWKV